MPVLLAITSRESCQLPGVARRPTLGRMTIRGILLALALPHFAGCAVAEQGAELPMEPAELEQPEPETPRASMLRIDADLPPEYQAAVLEGLGKWAAEGFRVPDVSIVPAMEANVRFDVDCLEVNPLAGGCAYPGSHVHFVPEMIEQSQGLTPEFVALHELGHFLGIIEHLPDGNVMQAGVTVPMTPPELTSADVAALAAAL